MKLLLIISGLNFSLSAFAQGDSMYVSGRMLYNNCKDTIVLHGINYPVLDDWDFPANMNTGSEKLNEIEKTGANCVRIQWYNNYGNAARSAYALNDLDSLLTRCARYNIVPIVGLWDLTSSGDWNRFPQIITSWWTQPSVVQLIKKHQRYLIVNIANELGHYSWSNNPQAALVQYESNYKTCITTLRNAGIHTPLLIDAPDGGQRMDVIRQVGASLIQSDPLKNILFGVHTYWWVYPNTNATPAQIRNEFQLTVNANLPIVLGEVANYQSESDELCTYDLAAIYPEVLKNAKSFNIGFIAWGWHKDKCGKRQLSSNGLAANLSAWGTDFINNPLYGFKNTTRNATGFKVCGVCVPYRTFKRRCSGRNTYSICTVYRNNVTGVTCETKCGNCRTYLTPR